LPARFDAVSADAARGWATLASLLGRLAPSGSKTPVAVSANETASVPAAREERSREPTTAVPTRVRHRKFKSLIGSSPTLERALLRLDSAIDSDLPVLIVGETGVGKELFARALHEHGARAGKPFVAVSCGAIPESLFEAELFGHARGAFTGADRARPGLLARAEGGSIFLDEVGELPLLRQAALLRALATLSYRPVGSDEERRFDVRVIAATNRDLEHAVAEGKFRADLLYRLNVLEIDVPPLRERGADVALLARHFLASSGSETEIAPAALAVLESYGWPGNVRELEHQIQRLSSLRLARVDPHHLSREVREGAKRRGRTPAARRPVPVLRVARGADDEREQVRRALDDSGGNITRAAQQLGLTRQGLKKRMLRLGMRGSVPAARLSERSARAKDRGR
jgi:two-component system response regulator HydG